MHRQALLQRRASERTGGGGNADERGVHGPDLAVNDVGDRPGGGRDPDRRQRRRRRGAELPPRDEQEQRDDHDASADAEECAEESRGEADQDQAHRRMLGP